MRRVAIERESAELSSTAHQRDERESCDSLLAHDAQKRRLVPVGDVLNEDWLRVRQVGRPGRATLGVGAVALREPAPGAEAEHAVVVGEQNRSAFGTGRLE